MPLEFHSLATEGPQECYRWHRIDYETIGANGSMLMVATSGAAVVI